MDLCSKVGVKLLQKGVEKGEKNNILRSPSSYKSIMNMITAGSSGTLSGSTPIISFLKGKYSLKDSFEDLAGNICKTNIRNIYCAKKKKQKISSDSSIHCIPTRWILTPKLNSMSLNHTANRNTSTSLFIKPLSFSSNTCLSLFSQGVLSVSPFQWQVRRCLYTKNREKNASITSVQKSALRAKKRRSYIKVKMSKVRTMMKKVLEALEKLKWKPDAQPEEVEKLVVEGHSAIDKAVRKRTLHRNTGARRKSLIERRKKSLEIHHGWHTPDTNEINESHEIDDTTDS